MIREPHIPLFLWIATALVVHAIGGEGATEVAQVLEERMDIRSFASSVRSRAMRSAEPLEVSLETEPEPEEPSEDDHEHHEHEVDTERVDDHELPKAEPDPVAPKPEEKVAEKAPEPEKKVEEAKPADQAAQKLALLDNRRIAVQQKVEDENQADNPNAEFAGDHANHVKEQTQARITSTDQNDANPTPGGNHSSADPNPGNSDDQKVAQSEEKDGEKDAPPDDSGEATKPTEASQATAQAPKPAVAAAAAAAAAAAQRPSPEQRPSTASPEVTGAPEIIAQGEGPGGVDRPKQSSQARAEQKWKPPVKNTSPTDFLGYGSSATTSRGVNLNLSRSSALAIVGADHMAMLKKRAGEKRLSAHRGSFQNLGIERWRSAIENYISTVKPGNQTALNTARVPFAAYLNQIHQRLHSIFADDFLGSLEGLPADHPLSNLDMSTHIEIALDRQDGHIVKMGVTKSSGVTMFDVGALESVKKAAPYGVPPQSIVSSDGNVYLHWEFHRRPVYACSTYFARPFILNLGPEQAPPRVDPPRRPTYDEQPPDSRSGALPPEKRNGKGA